MPHLFGYVRVSTAEQSHHLQRDAILAAGVSESRIFEDTISGAKGARPGLDLLLSELHGGDTLIIWRLDRLGRSMVHLASLLQKFRDQDVQLKSLTEGLDTNSASGRMVFGVLSSLAEFERETIVERVRAGIQASRKRGVVMGRPRGLTAGQRIHAAELRASGKSFSEIGEIFGVSASTIFRNLRDPRPVAG